MADTNTPDYQSDDFASKFAEQWAKVDVVLGGTYELRNHPAYLPRYPAEHDEVYKQRLNESTFDNEYADTLDGISGMLFRKPPTLGEDVPPQLKSGFEDIDLMGTHFDVFAEQIFVAGINYGGAYVLTDMQQPRAVTLDASGQRSAADAEQDGLRPYCVLYPASQVQNCPRYVTIRGARTLQQIVFKECVSVPDGKFGETEKTRYRVWRLPVFEVADKQYAEAGKVEWELWEESTDESGNKKVELVDFGVTELARIPVRPFIANPQRKDKLLPDGPALNDLIDLCIKKYQKVSNFEADLKYCVAVPWTAGIKEKDGVLEKQAWGRGVMFNLEQGGEMGFAEPNGNAFPTWESYLDRLEAKIVQKGLEIVIEGGAAGVATTATEQVIRARKRQSRLARWNTALHDCLEGIAQDWAHWLGLGDDAGGTITMGMSGDELTLTSADVTALGKEVTDGHISLMTYLSYMQRAEILVERTPEEEVAQIGKEQQAKAATMPQQMPVSNGQPANAGANGSAGMPQ